jgi:superfamily II DNA/RNA helicase
VDIVVVDSIDELLDIGFQDVLLDIRQMMRKETQWILSSSTTLSDMKFCDSIENLTVLESKCEDL